MVKSASGECHGSRDLWTGHGGLSLCAEVDLAGVSRLGATSLKVGAAAQEKFKVLLFRMKNVRSGLNWLCLIVTLLKALFL
jgi:hypothetical protein